MAKLVVGLVGGIGSGKSRVAQLLTQRGARVISGDELAHAALRQPPLRERIVARWGPGILDSAGHIDRKQLAQAVFADPAQLRELEEVVHPWIKDQIRRAVASAAAEPDVRLIVLDAAIMLEAGWEDVCDRLVFVDSPREVRLRRVAEQRGWMAQDLEARERAQLPLTAKAARADHVLDNGATLDKLEQQVDVLLRLWGLKGPTDGEPGASRPYAPSPDPARDPR